MFTKIQKNLNFVFHLALLAHCGPELSTAMESISKYLKENSIYDRLKNRIKTNIKTVDSDPHSKIKPANEVFDCFRGTQDGVLSLYLIWDVLETLKLTHTMYLFRSETGFDPTKIVNPHVLNHMHEMVRDRSHCDVILAHQMQWYVRDYTPKTDMCCQRKLIQGLVKETGLGKFKGPPPLEEKVIPKRNLLDGNASRVTVSIHVDDDDTEPNVIEIPRDTNANKIKIYLKKGSKSGKELKSKLSMKDKCDSDSSTSSSSSSDDSTKTEKTKKRSKTKSKSSIKEPLGDENDEQGNRRGFRRSPSPSRTSLSLKGGNRKYSSASSCNEDGNETDSYSYIHNPELHSMFMEELRKVKEKNRFEGKSQSCPRKERDTTSHHPKLDKCTVMIGYLVKGNPQGLQQLPETVNHPHHEPMVEPCPQPPQPSHVPMNYTPIPPHLVNQCDQIAIQGGRRMCNNPNLCQPPRPRPCSPDRHCFNEQVRRGTEDLITSSEMTRRFQDVAECEEEIMPHDFEEATSECKPGFVGDITKRFDNHHNENLNKVGGPCGSMMNKSTHNCASPPRSASPVSLFHSEGQCHPPQNMRNDHHMDCNARGPGCHGHQPDVLSEFD